MDRAPSGHCVLVRVCGMYRVQFIVPMGCEVSAFHSPPFSFSSSCSLSQFSSTSVILKLFLSSLLILVLLVRSLSRNEQPAASACQDFTSEAHCTGYKSSYGSLALSDMGLSTSDNTANFTLSSPSGFGLFRYGNSRTEMISPIKGFADPQDISTRDQRSDTARCDVQLTRATDLSTTEFRRIGGVRGNIAFSEL